MNLIIVGIAGIVGAVLRYQLGMWLPVPNGFPLGTLSINLAGCFILAWFFTLTLNRWKIPQGVRLGVGTGFIGSFTTFSTFSAESLQLVQNSQYLLAAIYVTASVCGGISMSYAGSRIAKVI